MGCWLLMDLLGFVFEVSKHFERPVSAIQLVQLSFRIGTLFFLITV